MIGRINGVLQYESRIAEVYRFSNHHCLRKTKAVARGCSLRKGVLRNFAKFTGKHLCQSFAKFLKTPFLKEHLRVTASGKILALENDETIELIKVNMGILSTEGGFYYYRVGEFLISLIFSNLIITSVSHRSSHRKCSMKKNVLKIFVKFFFEVIFFVFS